MNEGSYISTTKMVVCVLWGTVAGLTIVAWALLLIDYEHRVVALMLAALASTLSAAAVVAHLRIYTMRVANLIRVTSGLTPHLSGPSESTLPHLVR